jgi:hypothetical protein
MPWIKLVPANAGGGRQPIKIACRLNANGQFSMTHAVAKMLGEPSRVLIEVDPEAEEIRLTPTTPNSKAGYALSGGGDASHRLSMREAASKYPQLAGEYVPRKQAGSVLFVKKSFDDED